MLLLTTTTACASQMFSDVAWDVSVLLVTRAMSLEFDRLVSSFFPAYILFPPYTNGADARRSQHTVF